MILSSDHTPESPEELLKNDTQVLPQTIEPECLVEALLRRSPAPQVTSSSGEK